MFDVGFWELALILVVALLVVGPERLPGLARTAGLWMGRARRFLSTVKADIDRELRAEELRRILNKQAQVPGVDEIIEEGSMAFRSQELGGKSVPPTPPSGDRAKSVSGTPSAPTGGRAQSASAPPSTPAAPSSSPSADEGK